MDGQHDAIVVGGGPAGTAAATLLAQRGRRVLLLDRAPAVHRKLCTHAIMPAGLPVLAAMDALDEVQAAGAARWTGVRLWLNGAEFSAPLPRRRTAYAHGLSLRRATLDVILLRAAERAGVEVGRGAAVTAVHREGGRVVGVSASGPRGEHRYTAAVTVIAGGRRSRVTRASGVGSTSLPNRHTAYVAYLADVAPTAEVALEGYYLHGRSASLLPADGGLRVGGVMAEAGSWRGDDPYARLLAELRRFPPLRERLRDARVVTRPVPVRGLRNVWRAPRMPGLLLAGDAAMQTDPLFGQGIAFALRSGAWAAEAIDAGLEAGDLDAALAGYARRRARVLGPRFAGMSAFSLIPPGSLVERLLVESARAAPLSTRLALRVALGFATVTRDERPRRTLATWAREALCG